MVHTEANSREPGAGSDSVTYFCSSLPDAELKSLAVDFDTPSYPEPPRKLKTDVDSEALRYVDNPRDAVLYPLGRMEAAMMERDNI